MPSLSHSQRHPAACALQNGGSPARGRPRNARSLTDARNIVEELTEAGVRLNIGGSLHDPTDPLGRLPYNILGMIAEFESDLIRPRHLVESIATVAQTNFALAILPPAACHQSSVVSPSGHPSDGH